MIFGGHNEYRYKRSDHFLTTVGQRKKTGSSLNVILEQSGLITQEALDASDFTAEFTGFINEFLEGDRINEQGKDVTLRQGGQV